MSLSPSNKPDRLARLEARHLELLRALDELNVRVEEVLREFTRTDAQSQGVEGN